jgi:hypothetical protein
VHQANRLLGTVYRPLCSNRRTRGHIADPTYVNSSWSSSSSGARRYTAEKLAKSAVLGVFVADVYTQSRVQP